MKVLVSQSRTNGEISSVFSLGFGFIIMLSVTLCCWTFSKNSDGYIWGWAAGMVGVSVTQVGVRHCVAAGIGLALGVLVAYLGYYLVTGSDLALAIMFRRAFVGTFWGLAYFAVGAIVGAIISFVFLTGGEDNN